jgi:hypothetical protein
MVKKPLVLSLCSCLLVLFTGTVLYFFGPHSETRSVCPICGKARATGVFCGVTWFAQEQETELSNWYRHKAMKPHDHQWVHLCSYHQRWGGRGECWDSFGFELFPLHLLRQASEKVDQPVFDELVKDYYAMRQDNAKTSDFVTRCRRIVPDTDSVPSSH